MAHKSTHHKKIKIASYMDFIHRFSLFYPYTEFNWPNINIEANDGSMISIGCAVVHYLLITSYHWLQHASTLFVDSVTI